MIIYEQGLIQDWADTLTDRSSERLIDTQGESRLWLNNAFTYLTPELSISPRADFHNWVDCHLSLPVVYATVRQHQPPSTQRQSSGEPLHITGCFSLITQGNLISNAALDSGTRAEWADIQGVLNLVSVEKSSEWTFQWEEDSLVLCNPTLTRTSQLGLRTVRCVVL